MMRKSVIILFLLQSFLAFGVTYEYYNSGLISRTRLDGASNKVGQTFTIGTTGPNVQFYLTSIYTGYNQSSAEEVVTVQVYATAAGLPTGSPISTGVIAAGGSSTAFMSGVMLQPNTRYAFVVSSSTGTGDYSSNQLNGSYTGGNLLLYNGSSWSQNTAADLQFTINGSSVLSGGVIASNQSICFGARPSMFINTASASGGSGSYTYKWQYSTSSNTPGFGIWYDIANSNHVSMDADLSYQTRYYTRSVFDGYTTKYSNVITITVNPQINPGIIGGSTAICYNTDAPIISSTQNASGGTGTLAYRWYSSTGGSWAQITGATSSSYNPSILTSTTLYERRVIDAASCSATSNQATITVNAPLFGGLIGDNQTVTSSSSATLVSHANASGGFNNPTYSWRSSTTSTDPLSGSWSTISNSNSAELVTGPLLETTNFYRNSTDAQCGSANSNVVTVTVSGAPGFTITDADAYYKFDESSGSTATDEIVPNNATIGGGVTVNSTGKINSGYLFTGVNTSRVTLPSVPLFEVGTNSISVSVWFDPTSYIDTKSAILGGTEGAFCLFINTNGTVQLGKINISDGPVSSIAITANSGYHHLVVTLNNSLTTNNVVIYIDGIAQTLSWDIDFTAGAITNLIGQRYSNIDKFNGRIDEVAIWINHILTPQEASDLYNNDNGAPHPWNGETPVAHKHRKVHSHVTVVNRQYIPTETISEGTPPEDNFTGKVLFVDETGGDDGADGLTATTPIKTMTELSSRIDNTYDYIALSDETHYGYLPISSLVRTSGNPLKIKTWHKYGTGNATIDGRKTLGPFTDMPGNYWGIVDSQLPAGSPDANTNYIDYGGGSYLYFLTYMNGIYIDNVFYKLSKYPREKRYLKMEARASNNSYLDDTDSTRAFGYWTGATLCTQGPSWILTKAIVSNYNGSRYTLSGVADEELTGFTDNGTDGLKYYLINHRNATRVNGQWYSKQAYDSLVVYYNSNLNTHVIKAPVQDILVNLTSCQYITISGINFIGANQEHIRAKNNTGLVIENCNFYDAPYAALYGTGNSNLSFLNNNIQRSGDYGINLISNNNVIVYNNTFKSIGTDETFGGDRNGGHFNAIASASGTGILYINYNTIDSVAYCGIIVSNQTSTANGQVNIRRNFIKNALMSFSDGAGIYVFRCAGAYYKYIRDNLVINTYDSRAFHRNNGTESRAYYIDEGVDIYNDYWVCDSNYAYKAPQLSYINSGTNHLTFENNLFVDATFRGNNSENSQITYGLRIRQIGANMYNSSISRNTIVLSDSNSYGMYYTWQTPFNANGNMVDYNKYYNPFRVTTDEVWFEYLIGLNARDLNYVRANTSYEDNSTFNSNAWTFKNVTGITAGQFIQFFYNWSPTSHSFNLGTAILKDLSGNNIYGSVTLPAYSARCYFYVSGSLSGLVTKYP